MVKENFFIYLLILDILVNLNYCVLDCDVGVVVVFNEVR